MILFAKKRKIVERDGQLIMVDDNIIPLKNKSEPKEEMVRFRTLGCYPLTGGIDSTAQSVEDLLEEMLQSGSSERQGRLIDQDQAGSMEKKKREGYF